MKKNTLELALIGLVIFCILLKRLHVPGGPILCTISIISLALFYLVNGLGAFKSRADGKMIVLGNFLFSLFTAFFLFSILFQLMFWPSGEILAWNSLKITLFISLVIYGISIFQGIQSLTQAWNSLQTTFIRLFAVLCFALILSMLPVNLKIKLFSSNPERDLQKIESFKSGE